MKFPPGNAQHIGARSEQQDSFGFSDPDNRSFVAHAGVAAVVADGMGGMANGGAASQAAVHAFLMAYEAKEPEESIPDALLRSLNSANQAVLSLWRNAGAKESIGTTLAAVVLREDWLYWVSAGDSRIYFQHRNQLVQLTVDHVYSADLDEEVNKGHITPEQAATHPKRETLTSYLGLETLPRVDRSVRAFPVSPGDFILICSDGLYRALSDDEIAAGIARDPARTCETLVERAIAKHVASQDNITVIALRCQEEAAGYFGSVKQLVTVAALVAVLVSGFVLWRWHVPAIEFSVLRSFFGLDRLTTAPALVPGNSANAGRARVVDFRAEPSEVKRGGSVTLSWNVEGNLDQVLLNGDAVNAHDRRTMPDVQTATTYNLTAISSQAQVTSEIRQVTIRPEIKQFTVTPKSIPAGKSATLKWAVTDNAVEVRIEPPTGGGKVGPNGALEVSPAATTKYVLTAIGKGQPVTATVTVTVTDPRAPSAETEEFRTDKSRIKSGETATLTWNVSGEKPSVTIDNGIGRVKPKDSCKVSPSSKTTYTLTVIRAGGVKARRTVTVDVQTPPPPQIEVFELSSDGKRLLWRVTGAWNRIKIDPDPAPGGDPLGSSSPEQGLPIPSPSAGKYTLTVDGLGGTASKDVILPPASGAPQ